MKKSCGPDIISNEIIKHSSQVTLKAYTELFNLLLKRGLYPKDWKQLFIIMIHKSCEKSILNNYRGISLMNCLSKVFSALLKNRLTHFISNKYNPGQFGLRPNHRTSD